MNVDVAGREPVSRTKLTEEIVQVCIPRKVKSDKDSTTSFRYTHSVKNGAVPVCVRENPSLFKGKTITARLELWKNRYKEGPCTLSIELVPTNDLPPKYRLCVTPSKEVPGFHRNIGTKAFSTPDPLEGLVVLSPIKNK